MARERNEWIGSTDDTKIPPRVLERVYGAGNGICYECSLPLAGKRWNADHVIALINGGQNRESNLKPICIPCHKIKTAKDVVVKAKTAAVRQRHIGVTQPKQKIQSAGFAKAPKEKRERVSLPPRRMYQ